MTKVTIKAISITGVTRQGGKEVRTYPARDTARAMSQENVEIVRRTYAALVGRS
jgi:hypothetical protein